PIAFPSNRRPSARSKYAFALNSFRFWLTKILVLKVLQVLISLKFQIPISNGYDNKKGIEF
ncbi:MAG TPA: hypothetical protein PLJ08_13145, partial [Cyclobacteriaceae bacterium]|nr:hypothetical protein [Cyclobacteriaceae bacterium]